MKNQARVSHLENLHTEGGWCQGSEDSRFCKWRPSRLSPMTFALFSSKTSFLENSHWPFTLILNAPSFWKSFHSSNVSIPAWSLRSLSITVEHSVFYCCCLSYGSASSKAQESWGGQEAHLPSSHSVHFKYMPPYRHANQRTNRVLLSHSREYLNLTHFPNKALQK